MTVTESHKIEIAENGFTTVDNVFDFWSSRAKHKVTKILLIGCGAVDSQGVMY